MTQLPDNASYQGYPGGSAPTRAGIPGWLKVLIALLVIIGGLMILTCGGLMYLGAKGPDTKAVPGSQMRADHRDTIVSLGLLGPGEQIQYFYSDAMVDIESSMYFYTDEKVVVYNSSFADPAILVFYDEIANITADFSDSWFVDSTIWLHLTDGSEVYFPVCIEGGGDERFHDGLFEMWKRSSSQTDPQ